MFGVLLTLIPYREEGHCSNAFIAFKPSQDGSIEYNYSFMSLLFLNTYRYTLSQILSEWSIDGGGGKVYSDLTQ